MERIAGKTQSDLVSSSVHTYQTHTYALLAGRQSYSLHLTPSTHHEIRVLHRFFPRSRPVRHFCACTTEESQGRVQRWKFCSEERELRLQRRQVIFQEQPEQPEQQGAALWKGKEEGKSMLMPIYS